MISVCMATYNGERYIREQLESILKQLSKEDEVIISDDGSTDNTYKIVTELCDDRIKFVYNQGPHGFTHNFENALRLAKGEWIFLSDQDDVWKDNKVAVTMKKLENCDFVISDCITVDGEMNTIQDSRFEAFNIKKSFIRHWAKSRYLGCCMAFRRSVLDASLPFPKNDFLVGHDYWLAAIALLYFRTELVNEPLIFYRRHGENASSGGFEKGYSLKIKVKKRIYCMMKLLEALPRLKK